MVVCTLCSCYPWPVLGLPPVWYKSAPYRSSGEGSTRACSGISVLSCPRAQYPRLGFDREIRYLVLPIAPLGTDGWSEKRLAELVTRDSMIGTACRSSRTRSPDGGRARYGGGSGPSGATRADEPMFHAEWERRAFALTLAMGMPGGWNIDMSRFAREDRPTREYLGKRYRWLASHLAGCRDIPRVTILAGKARHVDVPAAGHPIASVERRTRAAPIRHEKSLVRLWVAPDRTTSTPPISCAPSIRRPRAAASASRYHHAVGVTSSARRFSLQPSVPGAHRQHEIADFRGRIPDADIGALGSSKPKSLSTPRGSFTALER